MVSRTEKRDIKMMESAIHQIGSIDVLELQEKLGDMPISKYNKLKPYLLKMCPYVEFNKQKQLFSWNFKLQNEDEARKKAIPIQTTIEDNTEK